MIPVSQNFKDLTYARGQYKLFARQFLPSAVLTLIDTEAQRNCTFTATSSAFYLNLRQLYDYNNRRTRAWGTLEDYQFLLDGQAMLMPRDTRQMQSQQNGWPSENMSGADGTFESPEQFNVIFGRMASTGGHLITFDPSYDSIPKDFDIIYYRNGTQVQKTEVRGNTEYVYNSTTQVDRYNQITFLFYSTTRPYRRIHVIEDMPGIFLNYGGGDIVTMDITQEVDPLSETLITGEATLGISNMSRALDILNNAGINNYLKQFQRVDMYMDLVYPDLTREKVHLGYWNLIDWQASKDMQAVFTVQDPTAAMNRELFRRLAYQENITLYELAELVFDDADILDYYVDPALKNYTCNTAQLPLAMHKECLRAIAQAAHAVVTISADGQIRVGQLNPLVLGKNLIQNPEFAGDVWDMENVDISIDYIYRGTASLRPHDAFHVTQTVPCTPGHRYYVRAYVYSTKQTDMAYGAAYLRLNDVNATENLMQTALIPGGWSMISAITTPNGSSLKISLEGSLQEAVLYFDALMCVDLTTLYGDDTPDAEWCEMNVIYFDEELMLPPYASPEADESLDYSTLMESPDIQLKEVVSGISVDSTQCQVEEEVKSLYEGTRLVRGTETFFVELESPAYELADVRVTGGELIGYTGYVRTAELTVRAVGEVKIAITGRAVKITTSEYTRTYNEDLHMYADAEVHELRNPLVSQPNQVSQLLSYIAYWLQQRYIYSFEWRQDPSVGVMDHLKVQDDFRNDKVILCTRNSLEYGDGVLSGSSEGVSG